MTVVSRNVKPTTHAHTGILLHCGGVQIPKLKKTDTEYLRLKIEPNRTEFEKSKLIQPYRWMIISVWCYHGRGLEYCIRPILLLLLPAGLRRCCCEVNVTVFLHVTLIRKPQSTSDLNHFHARELPCSCVKSHDDAIIGRQGDSGVLFSFMYMQIIFLTHRHKAACVKIKLSYTIMVCFSVSNVGR